MRPFLFWCRQLQQQDNQPGTWTAKESNSMTAKTVTKSQTNNVNNQTTNHDPFLSHGHQWGKWFLNTETLVLGFGRAESARYEVDLERTPHTKEMYDWLGHLSEKSQDVDLEGLAQAFEDIYRVKLDGEIVRKIVSNAEASRAPIIGPDGKEKTWFTVAELLATPFPEKEKYTLPANVVISKNITQFLRLRFAGGTK
jgi:hypothetical protein